MARETDRPNAILVVSGAERFDAIVRKTLSGRRFSSIEFRKNIAAARQCFMERLFDIVVINCPLPDEFGYEFALDITERSNASVLLAVPSEIFEDVMNHVTDYGILVIPKSTVQERMDGGGAEFGLVMLDVNYLKVINDQYGHAHGDDYLRTCCQMICHVFQHSPVYRVGGDEFVVLLEHDDLRDRDTLLAELDRRMEESAREDDPWKRVSLAKGMSVCRADDTRVDDVLHRADQAMYEDKRRMKAGR